jgi:hypothetical protein
VEPDRRDAFADATDARRAAWAWRQYVSAARAATAERLHEVRYERLAVDPEGAAAELAEALGTPVRPLAEALAAAHATSIGRFLAELTPEQLADIEDEAGPLLRELGYGPA